MWAMLKPRHKQLTILVLVLALGAAACPLNVKNESDIEKVESKLDGATNGVNALAKTVRELYRQNVINIANRKLAGKIIEEVNDGLEKVSDRVIQVDLNNPESVRLGKVDVENLLRKVIEKLNGFSAIDPKLQVAAVAITGTVNEAITLLRLVKEVRKP